MNPNATSPPGGPTCVITADSADAPALSQVIADAARAAAAGGRDVHALVRDENAPAARHLSAAGARSPAWSASAAARRPSSAQRPKSPKDPLRDCRQDR